MEVVFENLHIETHLVLVEISFFLFLTYITAKMLN